jgi:ATP-dependent Zn protease
MTIWGHDVVDIFINWFPMILLIGVWLYFLRRMQGGGLLSSYYKDMLAINIRQAEALERIAVALEKKV